MDLVHKSVRRIGSIEIVVCHGTIKYSHIPIVRNRCVSAEVLTTNKTLDIGCLLVLCYKIIFPNLGRLNRVHGVFFYFIYPPP